MKSLVSDTLVKWSLWKHKVIRLFWSCKKAWPGDNYPFCWLKMIDNVYVYSLPVMLLLEPHAWRWWPKKFSRTSWLMRWGIRPWPNSMALSHKETKPCTAVRRSLSVVTGGTSAGPGTCRLSSVNLSWSQLVKYSSIGSSFYKSVIEQGLLKVCRHACINLPCRNCYHSVIYSLIMCS